MNSKIAILLDSGIDSDGRVQRIIHSLSQTNIVHLFYIGKNPKDDKLFNENVTLFRFNIKENWVAKNFLFQNKFVEMENYFAENQTKYDFIYCNDYPLLKLAVNLKNQIKKATLIYDTHEIWVETINQMFPISGYKAIYGKIFISINKSMHRRLEKSLVKNVNHLITVCDSFKDYFEANYKVKDVLVIKNCPQLEKELSKPSVLRQKLNISEDINVVLYQGNLNNGRGLLKSIKSFKLLDSNYLLVILGGGHLLSSLKQYCTEHDIKNVAFIDKVPFLELLSYTKGADLGIMLIQPINISKELTLPNKIFEYMQAGVPVITNLLPEAKKIVLEEDCGYAISDNSEIEIANAIKTIFLDKSVLKQKGINGFHAIQTKYNWKNEILKLENLINQV